MDDEKLALQLDLTNFESMFELKTNEMSEELRLKKEAGEFVYIDCISFNSLIWLYGPFSTLLDCPTLASVLFSPRLEFRGRLVKARLA